MDYTKLIYSPLNIPESPELANVQEFVSFMLKYETQTTTKRTYMSLHGKEYPWIVLAFNADSESDSAKEFRTRWPGLFKYIDSFPIKGDRNLVFLAQKGEHDIFLHGDADGFGYRFHITNTNNESLFFHFSQDDSEQLPQTTLNWSDLVYTDEKIIAHRPSKRCPFVINSKLACHGVETNKAKLGDRIACLVYPANNSVVDKTRELELIKSSIEKFPESQIWYKRR
jgi:hypothetical protein